MHTRKRVYKRARVGDFAVFADAKGKEFVGVVVEGDGSGKLDGYVVNYWETTRTDRMLFRGRVMPRHRLVRVEPCLSWGGHLSRLTPQNVIKVLED